MRSFWWPASHVHFMLLLIYFCFTILLLVLKLHVFILKKILIYTKQLYPMLLFGHNYFLVNVLHVVIDIFCEQYNLFFKDYGNKLNRNLWQYKVYCIVYRISLIYSFIFPLRYYAHVNSIYHERIIDYCNFIYIRKIFFHT